MIRDVRATTEASSASDGTDEQPSIVFKGESGTESIESTKALLERVWGEVGDNGVLGVTFTFTPFYDPETEGFQILDWDNNREFRIAIPEMPSEAAVGLIYATAFTLLVMATAADMRSVSESEFRSVFGYATTHETERIRQDCLHFDIAQCNFFLAFSPSRPSVPSSTPIPQPTSGPLPTIAPPPTLAPILAPRLE